MSSSSSSSSTLIFISGASRGLGRGIAVEVVKAVNSAPVSAAGLVRLILTARDAQGVDETIRLVKQHVVGSGADNLKVTTLVGAEYDLSRKPLVAGVKSTAAAVQVARAEDGGEYDRVYIIHNAGTLGAIQYATGTPQTGGGEPLDVDAQEASLSRQLDLNVTSMALLTTELVQLLVASCKTRLSIVNISSLLAIQPIRGQMEYCIAKASRDMYMRVLACEQPKGGVLKTLNYAPGPLDTDMQEALRKDSLDKEMWQSMHREGKLVDVNASAAKLARLLCEDTFESGAHLDYFDV